MRELKRSIARSLMQDEGVAHINRKQFDVIGKDGKVTGKKVSYFSRYWKKYLNHYVDPDRFEETKPKERRFSEQFRRKVIKALGKIGKPRRGNTKTIITEG